MDLVGIWHGYNGICDWDTSETFGLDRNGNFDIDKSGIFDKPSGFLRMDSIDQEKRGWAFWCDYKHIF